MRIVLSNHARMRAEQRGISFEEIVDCILNYDSIETLDDTSLCYKKLQEKHLLLAYCTDSEGNITVITVIKTSKISKYFP